MLSSLHDLKLTLNQFVIWGRFSCKMIIDDISLNILKIVNSINCSLWKFQSLSHVQLFANPWTVAGQASLSIPSPKAYSNSCTLRRWRHPIISSCAIPFPPTFNFSQHQGLFKWVSSSHEVANGLEFYLQHQSFQWIFRTNFLQVGLVGSPCRPRDSQESSPTPQFKSINSSALSFLCGPTFTPIHDYWKNHSFD